MSYPLNAYRTKIDYAKIVFFYLNTAEQIYQKFSLIDGGIHD